MMKVLATNTLVEADLHDPNVCRAVMLWEKWRWREGMLCVWPNGNAYRVGQVNTFIEKYTGEDGGPCEREVSYPSNGYGDDYTDMTLGHPALWDEATLVQRLLLLNDGVSDWQKEQYYISPTTYITHADLTRHARNIKPIVKWQLFRWLGKGAYPILSTDHSNGHGAVVNFILDRVGYDRSK
jgi:hypothetical protein